jgi:hypothetical protein
MFRLLNLVPKIETERVNATVADGVLKVKLKVRLGRKVTVLAKAVGA